MKDREDRRQERLRQLGTDHPECSSPDCDEQDPVALTGAFPNVICYECRAIAQGRPWMEADHVAGARNDPAKALIPANDHRVRSDRQLQEWPRETLRNPRGSLLLWAAASTRGWADYTEIACERALAAASLIEALDPWLAKKLGERWWAEFINDTGWRKP